MIIAVDASGGEYAPHEIVKGAVKAAEDFKIGIALVGKKEILHVQARRHMKDLDISIVDAPEYIDDAESPIEAVTKKQNSSIVVGTMMVKTGKADAFVSARQHRGGDVCGLCDAGTGGRHRTPGHREHYYDQH